MAQVRKPEIDRRIREAALDLFARRGYPGTTMAHVAKAAGIATGNLYRYFPSKQTLFDAIVPGDLARLHDELLDARIEALTSSEADPTARDLLDFWTANRLAVVVLLDHAEGTTHAGYPARFVERLVAHSERTIDGPLQPADREVLEVVFDNTRRALAHLLLSSDDPEEIRRMISRFWSYQVPGLNGLMAHLRAQRSTKLRVGAPC